MNSLRTQVTWIESRGDYSIEELTEMSGLPAAVLDELVACGALPASGTQTTLRFEAETVVLARAAGRLHDHFELDERGVAVAVSLLRRVRVLEAQLSRVMATSTTIVD